MDTRSGERRKFDIRANLHSEFKFACFLNQFQENQNKRSHNTGIEMPQVFMNSRSELVKGSHRSPYVTRSDAVYISKLVTFKDSVWIVYPN